MNSYYFHRRRKIISKRFSWKVFRVLNKNLLFFLKITRASLAPRECCSSLGDRTEITEIQHNKQLTTRKWWLTTSIVVWKLVLDCESCRCVDVLKIKSQRRSRFCYSRLFMILKHWAFFHTRLHFFFLIWYFTVLLALQRDKPILAVLDETNNFLTAC